MFRIPSTSLGIPFHVLLLSLFLLLLGNSQARSLKEKEQEILLKMKQEWRNPPSLSSWNSSTSHCSWTGISCVQGFITHISLFNMSITGAIPLPIANLRNLTYIDFSYNYMTGEFPAVLYSCSKLQYLDLSHNRFAGVIPDDIQSLSGLMFLNLGFNNFSGQIPVGIGRLVALQALYLDSNKFNGTFPVEIGNLYNLEELYLSHNEFEPSRIPSEFTQLKKLVLLDISNTGLIGEIPHSMDCPDISHNQSVI
uniref:Leucine-rich repeat-containing N-terminal plant-type domain-containing protein n=1 Tax=Nelumbo nucifera TaxID=4432 RepID=A0A822ZD52_NELNU|nr:TPA_asm: hypothetical protein HUJ06_013820 [Nelumbo nucifera]